MRRHLGIPPLRLPFVIPASFALVAALVANRAEAGPNDSSNSRPWTLHGGLGPVINLESGTAFGRMQFDFEYHFFGGDVGPALGLEVPLDFRENVFGMHIGPIFMWDFRVAQFGSAKMYLAPVVSTGYSFLNFHGGGFDYTAHMWYMTLGGQFKMLWNDVIGFYVRPASFDVLAGDGGATGNWSLTAGVAAEF